MSTRVCVCVCVWTSVTKRTQGFCNNLAHQLIEPAKILSMFYCILAGGRGMQRVSFHGLCQRSSVKLRQVDVPAVVGMGTLAQLVATNIMLCSQ